MIIILSPAKTLDFKEQAKVMHITKPDFIPEASEIMNSLKMYDQNGLSKLMDISDRLAEENHIRHQSWEERHCISNSKQAVYAFRGEAYNGLSVGQFTEDDVLFAQDHLRIISGLYGILRPMDLIRPYRLEMGTKIKVGESKNLYEYWGGKIAGKINEDVRKTASSTIINLASNEYFKAVNHKDLKPNIITPVFKELKGSGYKTIAVYAKKARGLMSAWIIKNRIEQPEEIKAFNVGGYMFDVNQSDEKNWVFTRG